MADGNLFIYDKLADKRHVRAAQGFSLMLLLVVLAVFPWRRAPLPPLPTFVPVVDTIHMLFSAIIAAVLMSLASISRSRALIVLGAGYLFTGGIAVTDILTYPNGFAPAWLSGANASTGKWLYVAWHGGLTLVAIAYAMMKGTAEQPASPVRAPGMAVLSWSLGAVAAAVVVTWLATAGAWVLAPIGRALFAQPGQPNLVHYPMLL